MIKRLIKRVIVTGVGSSSGIAVATSFRRHGWLVVGVDSVFNPAHVHQFYIVSQADHPSVVDELLMVVRREKATLVLPTRPEEFLPLALRRSDFQRAGAGLYLPPPPAVENLLDPHLVSREIRRAGLAGAEPIASRCDDSAASRTRLFEVNLCFDDRAPYALLGSAVYELVAGGSGLGPKAERRKDDDAVEQWARQAAEMLSARGPITLHLRMAADGSLAVTTATCAPCLDGPLADEMVRALLGLWERDQPG